MIATSDDIILVLSGGSNNSLPTRSIGGDPSIQEVQNKINNLFSDVTETQLETGYTDYRCIYVFNNGEYPIYDVVVYILSETEGGSDIYLGVTTQQSDVQRIQIEDGTLATSGSFTISYANTSVIVNYAATYSAWADNISSALNSIDPLSGITCTASVSGSDLFFEIQFLELDENKNHDLIELVADNLIGGSVASITKVIEGSPINTIASEIGFFTNPPNDVVFQIPTLTDPLLIGNLYAGEGFPLWIQRVTSADEDFIEDNVVISISGTPIQF